MLKPLTPEMLEVIAYIEHHWYKHEQFPPVGFIKKHFAEFNLDAALAHETFVLALVNRGITVPKVGKDTIPIDLTPEQIAAILTVLDFDDRRSRTAKLKALDIPPTKWAGWLKDKNFTNFLQQISTTRFQDSVHVAHEGLFKAMDRGDTNAIKFYMEATGRYTANTATSQNIRLILARVVESIQRHIKDPAVLRAISNDFDEIMRGGTTEEVKELVI